MTPSHKLSEKAKKATILNNLHSSSLLSFGQLCDDGCDVLLQSKKCYVIKNKDIILQGTRNIYDKLWDIEIPTKHKIYKSIQPTPSQNINIIIRKRQTKKDLATYLHAACFAPTQQLVLRPSRTYVWLHMLEATVDAARRSECRTEEATYVRT